MFRVWLFSRAEGNMSPWYTGVAVVGKVSMNTFEAVNVLAAVWLRCVSICRDDSAEVDVYNPQKNEWDKISPMTQVCISHLRLLSASMLYYKPWVICNNCEIGNPEAVIKTVLILWFVTSWFYFSEYSKADERYYKYFRSLLTGNVIDYCL